MNLGNFNDIRKMIENQKNQLIHIEETAMKIEYLTGMTLDELLAMFAAGWKLSPPPDTVMGFSTEELMESMRKEIEDEIRRAAYLDSRKFDVELLKCQLETMDRMECNGIDLEGIGSSASDKIRPIWNLKIDFNEKPEEE